MLKRLREKWGLTPVRFFLVMVTFAITGTLTAWISSAITDWLDISSGTVRWWILKLAVLIFGYQVILLTTGFLLGQFSFFWFFEKKMLVKLMILKLPRTRIAVFASGTGTNARNIIEYFNANKKKQIDVTLLICNRPGAGVISIAEAAGIEIKLVDKTSFHSDDFVHELRKKADWLILAGFLWKIPATVVEAFPRRILNIHPALLPAYGGRGMYGMHVHNAVIQNGESESGISIHFVDEHYDNGDLVFQAKCDVLPEDSPQSLAEKIHQLEQKYYPGIIEKTIEKAKVRLNDSGK